MRSAHSMRTRVGALHALYTASHVLQVPLSECVSAFCAAEVIRHAHSRKRAHTRTASHTGHDMACAGTLWGERVGVRRLQARRDRVEVHRALARTGVRVGRTGCRGDSGYWRRDSVLGQPFFHADCSAHYTRAHVCALIAGALMAPSHNSTSQRTTIGAVSGMPALTSRVWDIRTHEANGEGIFGVNSAANVFRSPSYTYDLPKRKHKRRVRTRNTERRSAALAVT